MQPYEIKNTIIDDGFDGEESVTVDFTLESKNYSITFDKSDLEILNVWVFQEGTSLPANLSDDIIESIRDEVKERI
ncbi:hypothetical protein GCM10008967_30960 [Bacillus carboniphilus]|uniref:Uncharacterized protein n=1 Tax=Bacillus carboniphilus TaxID=86663 RepID=A0ABN0WHY7_9BACI